MTSTINKILVATLFTTLFFVAAFAVTSNASAYVTGGGGTGCTDCGGSGDGGSTPTPKPTTPGGGGGSTPVVPVCDLNAKPVTINEGENSQLSWTSRNAVSGSINQGVGDVNPNNKDGIRRVSPDKTTTYTLTVRAISGKSATCSAKVTVIPKPALPTCVLKAAPTTVAVNGISKLSWTTTNAISGVIDQGVGQVADPKNPNLTESVTVAKTTTYTMTVKNSAGNTATCSAKVTVVENPLAPECKSFTASPTRITLGNSTNLAWETVRATSISIDNAVGTVTPTAAGSVSVRPLQTTTYKATVVGNGGTVSCPVTVIVDTPINKTFSCDNNVKFSASATSIREGNSSTLTWTTTDADSVRINNGVNSTARNGSESVTPRSDTTYTLTAIKGNDSINCPLTINVDEDNGGGGGGGSSSPKCSLKISDNKISRGERVTLKWDTTRATEVTLKDSHGKTLIDTDDKSSSQKKDLYDGEITIRPEKDTTYTLVAEKGSKDRTCKVSVDVEDTIVVTQVRDQQPLVTGIALTQVPYTGFEAGPFMTSVFYTLLAAWALYMAYIIVGHRNGMSASTFTPARVISETVPSSVMFSNTTTTTPVFYQAPVAVVSTATVGYEAHTEVTSALEAQAHAAHVLLSTEAITYFVAATANEDRASILSGVLAAAKASYPSEDGWVVVSADRMVELASTY